MDRRPQLTLGRAKISTTSVYESMIHREMSVDEAVEILIAEDTARRPWWSRALRDISHRLTDLLQFL